MYATVCSTETNRGFAGRNYLRAASSRRTPFNRCGQVSGTQIWAILPMLTSLPPRPLRLLTKGGWMAVDHVVRRIDMGIRELAAFLRPGRRHRS